MAGRPAYGGTARQAQQRTQILSAHFFRVFRARISTAMQRIPDDLLVPILGQLERSPRSQARS